MNNIYQTKNKNNKFKILLFFVVILANFFFVSSAFAAYWFFDSTTGVRTGTITCGGQFYVGADFDWGSACRESYPATNQLYCLSGPLATNKSCNTNCSGSPASRGPYTAVSNAASGVVSFGVYSVYPQTSSPSTPTSISLNQSLTYSTTSTGNCRTNGVCGPANGSTVGSAPTINLCSTGTSSAVTGLGPWSWTCAGQNGGTTASCSAQTSVTAVNGVCGTGATTPANHAIYTYTGSLDTINASQLCSAGTLPNSKVLGAAFGSSVTWSCAGQGGGTSASCTATRTAGTAVNGVCGIAATTPAYHALYPYTGSRNTFSGSQLCSAGTLPDSQILDVDAGSSVTWTCAGQNGGSHADCEAVRVSAINGVCGPANGSTVGSAPTINLCSTGTSSAVTGSGPWAWTCAGQNGGTTASCSAQKSNTGVNGVCGTAATTPANHATYSYTGSTDTFSGSQLCSAGTSPSSILLDAFGGSSATWLCAGQNGGSSAGCEAVRGSAISGVCGPAARAYLATDSAYAGALCGAGNGVATAVPPLLYTTFPTTGNSTLWTCGGSNGGASSPTCTATRAAVLVAPSAITDLTASAISTSQINLAWTAPPTGGSDITGYKIERSVDGSTWTDITPIGGVATITYQDKSFIPLPLGLITGNSTQWFCNGTNGSGPTCTATRGGSRPTVDTLAFTYNNCAIEGASQMYFSWAYHNTNPQTGSRIQISTDSNFSDISKLVLDKTANSTGQTVYVVSNPQSISEPPQIAFAGSTPYYWHVQVSNGTGSSGWSAIQQFATPTHAYPYISISVFPTSPIIKYPFSLNAGGSSCYGSCSYAWTLQGPGNSNVVLDESIASGIVYNTVGTYTENVEVTDSDGLSCNLDKKVPVKASQNVPTWKEISPF